MAHGIRPYLANKQLRRVTLLARVHTKPSNVLQLYLMFFKVIENDFHF